MLRMTKTARNLVQLSVWDCWRGFSGQQFAKRSRSPDSTCPLWDFGTTTTTEGNTFESTGFLVFRVDCISLSGYNNFHRTQIASLHACYDNLQNIFGSFKILFSSKLVVCLARVESSRAKTLELIETNELYRIPKIEYRWNTTTPIIEHHGAGEKNRAL